MGNRDNVATTQPIHTPGPLEFLESGRTEQGINRGTPLTITEATGARNDIANVYSADDSTVSVTREQAIGNARLLAASYNAFDSAAKKLGLNAVEFSERMAEGGLAELVLALEECLPNLQGWAMQDLAGRPWLQKARAALVKVRGDAS